MSALRCRSHSSCTSFVLFILLFMKSETEESSHVVQQGNIMCSTGNKKEKTFWIEAFEAWILMQISQRLLCQVLRFLVYKTHLPARTLFWYRNTGCPLRCSCSSWQSKNIVSVYTVVQYLFCRLSCSLYLASSLISVVKMWLYCLCQLQATVHISVGGISCARDLLVLMQLLLPADRGW